MFSFNERKRAMRKEIQKELKISQLIQQEHEKRPHVPIGYIENIVGLCYAIEDLKEDNTRLKRFLPEWIHKRFALGIASVLFMSAIKKARR